MAEGKYSAFIPYISNVIYYFKQQTQWLLHRPHTQVFAPPTLLEEHKENFVITTELERFLERVSESKRTGYSNDDILKLTTHIKQTYLLIFHSI